jgi:CheY-like chemotaxis protein
VDSLSDREDSRNAGHGADLADTVGDRLWIGGIRMIRLFVEALFALIFAQALVAVLLDVQLPDGSGLALLDDLAARDGGRRPAIIAVTGGVLPEQQAAALAAGCDAIVQKPFIAAELVRALTDSIASHQPG